MDQTDARRTNMCERLKISIQNRSECTGLKLVSITENFVGIKNIVTKNISSLLPASITAATEAYNPLGKFDWKMFNSVLQRLGHVEVKQKAVDSLNEGAAKSFVFLEQIDDKLGLSKWVKVLDEQHHISKVTSSIITKVYLRGKEVFSEIREHNPKGALSIVRKVILDAGYEVLGYASLTVEKVAQFSSKEKSNEQIKTTEVNDENCRR